jgi:hypothetical protein
MQPTLIPLNKAIAWFGKLVQVSFLVALCQGCATSSPRDTRDDIQAVREAAREKLSLAYWALLPNPRTGTLSGLYRRKAMNEIKNALASMDLELTADNRQRMPLREVRILLADVLNAKGLRGKKFIGQAFKDLGQAIDAGRGEGNHRVKCGPVE